MTAKIEQQRTPQQRLAQGIAENNASMVETALKEGANPNLGPLGEPNYYPLQRAFEFATESRSNPPIALKIFNLLLEAGADPTINAGMYQQARGQGKPIGLLAEAVRRNKKSPSECLEVLLRHWPKKAPDWRFQVFLDHGYTLWHWAVYHNDINALKTLRNHGADTEVLSEDGIPALEITWLYSTVDALLELGSNPYARNAKGRSILWTAIGNKGALVKNEKIKRLLEGDFDFSKEHHPPKQLLRRIHHQMEASRREKRVKQLEVLTLLEYSIRRFQLLQEAEKMRITELNNESQTIHQKMKM